MSSKDAHLYGLPRHATKAAKKQLASSSDLAFSTALTSLISSSSSSTANTNPHAIRKRTRDKDDIFTTHNRNAKKRAMADELAAQDDPAAAARWKGNDEPVGDAEWRRAKRKMEEKARLYAAMKRGDVMESDDAAGDPKHMVDFDRKWAEKLDNGEGSEDDDDDDDDDDDGSDEEVVEYLDSFGRTRRGTRAEAAREQRRKQTADQLREEDDRYSARPSQPSNIIFGDTVQTAAFNPDEPVMAQMEELAKKRDREATPPDAVHYDANAEIRTRGTGFFQFSKDEEVRKQEMENLAKERQETERLRAEKARGDEKEWRKREIEERRKMIREKRGKAQADQFLETLENEMAGHVVKEK